MSLTLALESAPPVRLRANVVARPALTSAIRPPIGLPESDAELLLAGAATHDVRSGGYFAAERAAAQVWSGSFDGPDRTPGSAVHLGSVDWMHDTPARGQVTLVRVVLTPAGVQAGETTVTILDRVLALAGLAVDPARVGPAIAPASDPFRSGPQQSSATDSSGEHR